MASPTPVRKKSWMEIFYFPALILFGMPTLGV